MDSHPQDAPLFQEPQTRRLRLNLNRVEGDLELEISLDEDNVITDAWAMGTLYRGFEQILIGRDPMDALAITPRICGICGTAHLTAAVTALESAFDLPVPPNGIRVRNLCLMAEEALSDTRQTFLMFTPDLAHSRYRTQENYADILADFAEMQGRHYRQAVRMSKKIVEVVAIFGGQWPHTSHMVPGGVTTPMAGRRVMEVMNLIDGYIHWLEQDIIGSALEAFLGLESLDQLLAFVEENQSQAQSALGRFVKACRNIGLHHQGLGATLMLSYGSYMHPDKWHPDFERRKTLRRGGVFDLSTGQKHPFDQQKITEDVSHAWFESQKPPLHPWDGETIPKYLPDTDRYTWAKAPRYNGQTVQTGPLSQLINGGDDLLKDMVSLEGDNAFVRQFARFRRLADTLLRMRFEAEQLLHNIKAPYIEPAEPGERGDGIGLVEAARGSLGHWVRIEGGKISKYQVVTPTAWNASPRDRQGQRGHMESSLIGLQITDPDDPLELGHVVRSHDPCLVCTVHVMDQDKAYRFSPM